MTLKRGQLFFDFLLGEGGEVGLHFFGDAFNGDHHLGIYCIYGQVQDLGHILVAEAIFAHQLEDHFAARWQRFHGGHDLCLQFSADHFLIGSGICTERYIQMIKRFRDLPVGPGRKVIEGAVLYCHVEIHADIRNGRSMFLLLPEFDKHIIHYLGGGLFCFHDRPGELAEAWTIILKQPAERLFITIRNVLKHYGWLLTYMMCTISQSIVFKS